MYSIKTDLGVSGNGTIDKDLLVKGNAVVNGNLQVDGTVVFADATFTQITVSGTANLADISSTGTASLNDVAVTGNTTLGNASTDTVTVNGTSTFAAPVTLNGAITQSAGTASFKATSADSLTVAGVSQLNGNLNMAAGTKATLKDLETDTLKVNGESILGGTLNVTGKSTFGDVEINGTLSGSYTIASGNFTNLTVSQLSTLNNVSISGNTTLVGNVTGSSSTVAVNRMNMLGSDAIVEFAYNDPARPTDIKSSIEPYQVSTNTVNAKIVESDSANIGVVGGTSGLHAIGRATIDYLNITGNSTIGDQNQLQVAGKSVFTGKTTVGDLEITGSVSGLSFSDLNVTSLTVTGSSNLQSVTVGGNLTGSTSAIAKFSTFTVGDGTGGNHGIVQFDYSDSGRPNDTKSSIEPYKVSTSDLVADDAVFKASTIGDVGGVAGLHAQGKATIDYLKIAGNSTIGTATPQLEVTGKSLLGDVEFTGTVTGLTVDVSGQDLTPNSVVAAAGVTGNTLASTTTLVVGGTSTLNGDVNVVGQTTTVKDLVVTGTTTGVTVDANVDGLDIKPNSVEVDTTLDVTGATTLTGVTVTGILAGTGGNEVIVSGISTAGGIKTTKTGTALDVSNNAHIGGVLTVDGDASLGGLTGTTTIHNLTVTGTTTGVTVVADVDGLDIKPASVEATGIVTGTNLTASGTVQGDILSVANNATVGGDLTVTGTLSAGTIDLSGADISANALTTAATVGVGTDLTVGGTATVTGIANFNNNVVVTGSFQAGASTVTDIQASGTVQSNSLNVTTDGLIGGDLDVTGTLTAGNIDLGSTDINANSLTTAAAVTVGTDLTVTGNVTGTLKTTNVTASGTLGVTGLSTLGAVTATNIGASDLNLAGTLDVTGVSTFDGNITSSNAAVAIVKNTAITGNLTVSGSVTPGSLDLSTTDISSASLTTTGNTHVGGDLTVDGTFDLSATDLSAASLASTGNTTVGANLVLTTGVITGAPQISGNTTVGGTLGVTGATTLAGVTATTLAVPSITGNTTFANNVTVNGTFTPTGGLDLSGADVTANSVTTTANVAVGTALTVGTTLNVTGASTLAGVTATTVTGSGLGKFGSVTADNGATVTAGNLVVTAGNISQNGAATATASFKKTSTTNLHVGSLTWDEETYIAEIGGSTHISGDLDVDGTINAQINLTGRDIAPRSITTSQSVSVGTTLDVTGQSTMASAIIGAPSSVNNNLQVNGNTVCTGNFTVQGLIIGTLDQTTSDVTFKSVTTTAGASIGTNATVGGTLGVTGTTTLGVVNSGNTAITGTLSTTALATLNSASVTTTLGVSGNTTLGGTLGVTGATTLAGTTISSLSVTGTSGFTGLVTTANLTSTGLITANDLTVTGTFSADIASLTTTSISTQKYEVIPATSASVASGTTWTSDGSSNVYNLTLTGAAGAVNIAPLPIVAGKAASWFIYITQDSTGGKTVNWDTSMSQIGDSIVNTAANSVSICQVVYCGVGSIVDVFIAQRNL